MLTQEDKAYIQERVAYALAAIKEVGASSNNLAAIIGQEIGLAIQHEREDTYYVKLPSREE